MTKRSLLTQTSFCIFKAVFLIKYNVILKAKIKQNLEKKYPKSLTFLSPSAKMPIR
jgi:hypothetical protein